MTYQQILAEIAEFPTEEKMQFMMDLNQLIQKELRLKYPPKTSAERVRGMLKPEGELPSDEELKEDYINYLIEKYT